jgi:hypothetical protein
MYRNSDGASLIGDRTSDTLTDPPRCIGRELKPSIRIEFINRSEESDISLLNEVEEPEPTTHILLRDRDNESEVRFCETFTGTHVTLLNEVSETDFLTRIDEREATDLIEIHADRVIRDIREVDLIFSQFRIREQSILIERIDELDLEPSEPTVDLVHEFDIFLSIRDRREDFIEGEFSFGLSFLHEELDILRHTLEEFGSDGHIDEFLELFLFSPIFLQWVSEIVILEHIIKVILKQVIFLPPSLFEKVVMHISILFFLVV